MSARSLILASASPRRKELLGRLGVRFEVMPAEVEEVEDLDQDPEGMVRHNAALKATHLAQSFPGRFVLGADTTVHLDGKVLNKPADMLEARRMLRSLAGRAHAVYTGFALICLDRGVKEVGGARSEVAFKPLDEAAIDRYFSMVDPLDKAGAYGIQEGADLIIERYAGSRSNIMGLPLDETKALLRRHKLI